MTVTLNLVPLFLSPYPPNNTSRYSIPLPDFLQKLQLAADDMSSQTIHLLFLFFDIVIHSNNFAWWFYEMLFWVQCLGTLESNLGCHRAKDDQC